MSDKYFTVNIRVYLDKNEPTYIGEESLYYLLSDFSCPKNPDVEYFLLHNAIEFTKGETDPWKYSTGICTGNHIQSQIFRRWRYGVS